MSAKAISLFILFSTLFLSGHAARKVPSDCQVVIVGAGIGGAYVAYRLAVEIKSFPAHQICIFEARSRPGGRILSVRGAVPGFENYTVDLGAYRYGRTDHHLVRLVAESVLNLEYQCYNNPRNDDDTNCEASVNRNIFTTRGRIFPYYPDGFTADTAMQNYTRDIPYTIPPSFRWRLGSSVPNPRDPYDLVLSADTVIPEVASRLSQLEAEVDYAKSMSLCDEIIADVNKGEYKGIPYWKLTLWQLATSEGMTEEELRFFVDRSGPVTADELQVSIVYIVAMYIRYIALHADPIPGPKQLVSPVTRIDGVPRRTGMLNIVHGLLDRVVEHGVRVFYNRRVIRLSSPRSTPGKMAVILKGGHRVKTSNVFLNIPKHELTALGLSSQPMRDGRGEFLHTLSSLMGLTLLKTYCFWKEAWWLSKLKLTRGIYRVADGTLFQGRYHDGDVTCTDKGDLSTCRGALMVSYISGSNTGAASGISVRAFNDDVYSALSDDDNVRTLIVGNMTAHERMYFDDIHRQIRRAHKETFDAMGMDVEDGIPDAVGCVYADWKDIGMHFYAGSATKGVNIFETFARPVKGLNVSLVNEAYSDISGWAEGSLLSAERALYHVHGAERPAWMDEVFHQSMVVKYNRG